MRESEKPLKPWRAIPVPKAVQKPPLPPIAELKKATEIPVDRNNAPLGSPEYTAAQIDHIKDGIRAGWRAMEKRGAYPLVFVDAFCKAGGIQVPGFPQVSADHLRVLGSIILMWLEKPDYGLLKNWRWINDAMVDTLHRELNRVHQITGMFSAKNHPDAYGWRFRFSDNAVNPEACRRLAQCDNYGLGAGIFPLDIPNIFQPIYDRSWLEIVYRDEV